MIYDKAYHFQSFLPLFWNYFWRTVIIFIASGPFFLYYLIKSVISLLENKVRILFDKKSIISFWNCGRTYIKRNLKCTVSKQFRKHPLNWTKSNIISDKLEILFLSLSHRLGFNFEAGWRCLFCFCVRMEIV